VESKRGQANERSYPSNFFSEDQESDSCQKGVMATHVRLV